MAKVLILDDMALFRDLLGAALAADGHAVRGAGSARDAMAAAREHRPDLVLLEPASGGGRADGLSFLGALRADRTLARVPVLILAAAADRRHITEAVRLGVTDYVLKGRSSVKDLLKRVGRACAAPAPPAAAVPAAAVPAATPTADAAATTAATPAGPPGPLLTREACLERVERAMQAKTLSGVVAQVVSLAASPRADLAQLAELIGRDVVLSSRVLHAANSAAYASARGPIASIPQAVRQIGCSTVRDIAASVGVFDAMPATAPDGFNPIRCWQHSFAVARLCGHLTAAHAPERAGTAYLVGLCHDLGGILFRTHFGAEYGRVLDARRAGGPSLRRLEREMLGITQDELSLAILRRLDLPAEIREPIESAHGAGGEPGHPLGRVLRLADLYANGLQLAAGGSSPVSPVTRADCRRATGADAPPAPEAGALRSEIMTLTLMLARLDPDAERALTRPAHPQRDVPLWLAREAGLSPFDPLAAALDSLGRVTVSDRLPRADEAAGLGGLVVTARSPRAAGLDAAAIATVAAARAGGQTPLPVLWLTGRSADSPPSGAPAPAVAAIPWAIPLDDLAAFVARCAAIPAPADGRDPNRP